MFTFKDFYEAIQTLPRDDVGLYHGSFDSKDQFDLHIYGGFTQVNFIDAFNNPFCGVIFHPNTDEVQIAVRRAFSGLNYDHMEFIPWDMPLDDPRWIRGLGTGMAMRALAQMMFIITRHKESKSRSVGQKPQSYLSKYSKYLEGDIVVPKKRKENSGEKLFEPDKTYTVAELLPMAAMYKDRVLQFRHESKGWDLDTDLSAGMITSMHEALKNALRLNAISNWLIDDARKTLQVPSSVMMDWIIAERDASDSCIKFIVEQMQHRNLPIPYYGEK